MNTKAFAQIESPLGPLLLAADETGLRSIEFVNASRPASPDPEWHEDFVRLQEAARQLRAYFAGELETFELPLPPAATPSQPAVSHRLCETAFAQTISYDEPA